MERVCFLALVRPGRPAEYRERHRAEFFVADGPPDQSFRRLDEIFHLD